MQDMRAKPPPPYLLERGRVLDVPVRHRTIKIGARFTYTMTICYHGRPYEYACGLCEFEYPRLKERDDGADTTRP
jgi:hypothetical protein